MGICSARWDALSLKSRVWAEKVSRFEYPEIRRGWCSGFRVWDLVFAMWVVPKIMAPFGYP